MDHLGPTVPIGQDTIERRHELGRIGRGVSQAKASFPDLSKALALGLAFSKITTPCNRQSLVALRVSCYPVAKSLLLQYGLAVSRSTHLSGARDDRNTNHERIIDRTRSRERKSVEIDIREGDDLMQVYYGRHGIYHSNSLRFHALLRLQTEASIKRVRRVLG